MRGNQPFTVAHAVLVAAACAMALPALAMDAAAARRAHALSPQEHQAIAAYWTPERMAHATPMNPTLQSRGQHAGRPATRQDAVHRILQPTVPLHGSGTRLQALPFPEMGAPWPGGGQIAATSGRLFFDIPGSGPSWCTANAVTSANRSTVITAGHCLTLENQWFENVIFVPGYRNGHAPHGVWSAKQIATTPQWAHTNDTGHDVGALTVNLLEGKALTDVVGGSGLEFNRDTSNLENYGRAHAFGYPFNYNQGETLTYCSADTVLTQDTLQPAMLCGMTGGASGGPWMMEFSEQTGLGIQNSVNHKGGLGVVMGSYFGASAEALYDAMQKGF